MKEEEGTMCCGGSNYSVRFSVEKRENQLQLPSTLWPPALSIILSETFKLSCRTVCLWFLNRLQRLKIEMELFPSL